MDGIFSLGDELPLLEVEREEIAHLLQNHIMQLI